MKRHAEISGAGFAGLVAGISLVKRGWSVRIHEKAPELRAFGAGIFIWENGLRVLHEVGAYEEVVAGAHEAGVYEVRQRDRLIDSTVFSAETDDRMLTMTRQTLYAALLRVAESAGVDFCVGSEVTNAESRGFLEVRGGRRFLADLVVGADGSGHRFAIRWACKRSVTSRRWESSGSWPRVAWRSWARATGTTLLTTGTCRIAH